VVIYGCRELVPTAAVRARASDLIEREPWGRSQWERLAAGQSFDGMEAWLPWLHTEEQLVTDLLAEQSQVVLVEPRRVRDRAAELYDEEGALAGALASTWGYRGEPETIPRLHAHFDRLLEHCDAAVLALPSVADGPSVPAITVRGFPPVTGDAAVLARQVVELTAERFAVALCASSAGAADRLSRVLADEGVVAPVVRSADAGPGAQVLVAPLSSGFVLPDSRLALLAESNITGRRLPHRPPRPRTRPTEGFFDDLAPGNFVVHRQHGVARYAGVTTRTVAGATRTPGGRS